MLPEIRASRMRANYLTAPSLGCSPNVAPTGGRAEDAGSCQIRRKGLQELELGPISATLAL